MLGPPLSSTSSDPDGSGGGTSGPGGGSGGSGQNPEIHTASFIIPIEFGQINIDFEWRIQRFGTYLEATVLVTLSPAENVTLHYEYAGAFTVHRHGDYEARYTGTIFSLDTQEPITLEVSGRVRSGVDEDEAPGLVFETTPPESGPMLIPTELTLFNFDPDPDEGTSRSVDGPGFQNCGASCRCLLTQDETIHTDECRGVASKNSCQSSQCVVNPNTTPKDCSWVGGGICSSGVAAAAPLAAYTIGLIICVRRTRRRWR